MKVYITIQCSDPPKILGVYADKEKAEEDYKTKTAWINIIEKEVIK